MRDKLKSWWKDESGQGLAEYAFILALISLAAFSLLSEFGQVLAARLTGIEAALP